ncbi:MAG: carbohydrate porin [Planctomycetota bacterium]
MPYPGNRYGTPDLQQPPARPLRETSVELFCKAPVCPWFMVQPDLQYLACPNGNRRGAFVFGLRFETVL